MVEMSVKVAHLSSDIANARSIHQHQDGAIQLSQKTGKRACACLAGIFPQAHISAMVKTVFNGIITNDKFCLSRTRHLPKKPARRGFSYERQYPSEATSFSVV
ncbi:hypothetical protein Krac_6396 [Ktedonobacter racemifer DSM 44963]|uniref:Uncharacterized protein n=1 Tax=Ktedonobacter racemifer DSM 44963 TaxID=485913 RepID=D6TUC4_KTERA|nr:hypothetical protein Krac_6396 [Ktedonobacter racemifer DSM 44963]